MRRAEAAALAQGYFAILVPAYAAQRGAEAAASAQAEFANLLAAYRAALDALPPRHAAGVTAYVAALHAEAAARRTESNRLRAALEARTRGDHRNEGARP